MKSTHVEDNKQTQRQYTALQFSSPFITQRFFSPPSPVYCPGRFSSTQHNEAGDILRGESCCQPGPLEPTYCVFAEAAVEQNAALGSISHTSREQDEALLALLALLAQCTGLSLYHI